MSRKIVHVVGTGTIGEPLIGLLCDFKESLGIDEITFHKNTPLTTDRSKVVSLCSRGAVLSTQEEKIQGFKDIGAYSIVWNGHTDSGVEAPSGVYFLNLKTGNDIVSEKITLLR